MLHKENSREKKEISSMNGCLLHGILDKKINKTQQHDIYRNLHKRPSTNPSENRHNEI